MAYAQTYDHGSLFMNHMNAKAYMDNHRDDHAPSFALAPHSTERITERLQTRVIVVILDPKTLVIIAGPYEQLTHVNYADRTGHFAITASVIFWAAIIGAAAGAVVGGAAGGITAAATGGNVGLGVFFGALGGAVMGAGAGVGSAFIAPVIAGGTAVVAGHALATGAAWGIGLGIGFTAGAVVGGAQEFFNQWSNSDWDISKVRFDQVGWSALENGTFNTLSTVLGGFGGTDLRRLISFILGAQLNVIPSGYTTIADIIKWCLQKEKTA